MRQFIVLATMVIIGLSCGQADFSRHSGAEHASGMKPMNCEDCFMLSALGRYLEIPSRYVVRRSAEDGCLVLTAPFSVRREELGTANYLKRLRTESGLVRYCERSVLDHDVAQIEEKSGSGTARDDGDVTVRSWSSAELKTPFTATYFARKNEGLLIFDIDGDFAEKIWREGTRD
jgi:hypothetical protein